MNREIKFRGKQKTWIYGGISIFNGEATILDYNSVANSAYEVDIGTVGQYTGLKDRNGIEIYEGDVFDDGSHVVFEEGKFGTTYSTNQQGVSMLSEKRCKLKEVIGNIHEQK